jgi:hypothetical protein
MGQLLKGGRGDEDHRKITKFVTPGIQGQRGGLQGRTSFIMSTTGIETRAPESSHVESQGPFHRVFIQRGSILCLPQALFDNVSSEARDHCGMPSQTPN